jgi:hypothetical protein
MIINRIYALDPAAPGFETKNWMIFVTFLLDSISKDDAKFVQVIHTTNSLGCENPRGHVDFYVNGGIEQTGCDLDAIKIVCNHRRSWEYYQESVRDPNSFIAVECDSWDDFRRNKCENNTQIVMGFRFDDKNFNQSGKFFLRTLPNYYHLSMGINGIRNVQKTVYNGSDDDKIDFVDGTTQILTKANFH